MLDDQIHHLKRRKVRKGTQSCWECKRRKVRCIFASAEHAVCNNCRRRGTVCVSQELPDTAGTFSGQSQVEARVEARLDRVEELVEQLVNARAAPNLDRDGPNAGLPVHRAVPSRPPTRTRPLPGSDRYEELSRNLLAAWPSRDDLEAISSLPVGLLCLPLCWRSSTLHGEQSPREMLKLPAPGAHPVLIAQRLLMLGTFLQGVPPSAIQQLGDRGVSYRETMTRAVDRAITLVTTNDELICSVEGLECLMMETMFQNYAGNLHRAWMAVKRATSAAQMMGLHRARDLPASRFLDPATRAAFDADNICFRLVQMDHYLSLMLGLPQTAPEGRFAIPADLSGFDPRDRLERLHCAVSGRIVQRNDAGINDLSVTCEADKLLQTAAAEMPPQWWLPPTFSKDSNLVADTMRLMIQFTHHHLLARLHLPYMLRSSASTDHNHDRSRTIAVNASRELLSRYVLFRSGNPVDYYCRGCDFLAFVATTIMCLAHINTNTHSNSNNINHFDPLRHSRPTDRGLMERTAEIIASTAAAEYSVSEAIAPKLTRIIRHLLDVESNAANGTIYSTSTSSSATDGDEGGIGGALSKGGKTLQIRIPYFGTIRLERGHGGIPKGPQVEVQGQGTVADSYGVVGAHADGPVSSSWGVDHDIRTSHSQVPASNGPWGFESQPDPMYSGAEDDWNLQGIDVALFDSLFRGIEIPDADTSGEAWI
ncbi:hypothetical protein BDW72DRAFT_210019 [Aspergillus terricola var. indicus]